jgi:hypothetical protein
MQLFPLVSQALDIVHSALMQQQKQEAHQSTMLSHQQQIIQLLRARTAATASS